MLPETETNLSPKYEMLWMIPNRVLNILISPGGRGKLARPPGLKDELDLDGMDLPLSIVGLLLVYITLPTVLRYILGHVTPTLLTIQLSQDQAALEKSERVIRKRASFRNVGESIRLVYRAQGLYTFIRALFIGSMHLFATSILTGSIQTFLFRHELLRPLAYAFSSAIFCEFHLVFMCATVSVQRVSFMSILRRKSGQNRWKHLAIPAFLYGLSQALMDQLYDFLALAIFTDDESYTSTRAAAEVLGVIIMLAFRFLALLPTYIALTLAEAKFLSPEIETVVPSSTKERGLKIGELTGDQKPPSGLAAWTSALEHLGTSRYLQLIELHLKKCFVQIGLEIAIIAFVMAVTHIMHHEDEGID